MADKDTDLKKIKELVDLMVKNDLVEVEIIDGENKISLKRPQASQTFTAMPMMPHHIAPQYAPAPVAAPVAAAPAAAPEEKLLEIKSPIVGTFYATPSPDSEPFVKTGTDVNAETVVCIIEAMKVMNEIKAEMSGTIVKVLVSNGQAVEYGQPLFKVRPN